MTSTASTNAARRPTRAGFVTWVVVVTLGIAGGAVLAQVEDQHTAKPTVRYALPALSADLLASLRHRHFLIGPFRQDGPSWVRQSRKVRIDRSKEYDRPLGKAAAVTSAAEVIGLPRKGALGASLISLTTPEIGLELEPDPSLPSHIAPDYLHTNTWAVVFGSVQYHVGGPAHVPGPAQSLAQSPGLSSPARFVVFVDAYAGTLMFGTNIGGSSVSLGGHSGPYRGPPSSTRTRAPS